jgi:hypothetical protein
MAFKFNKRKNLTEEQKNKINEYYLKKEIEREKKERHGHLKFTDYSKEGTRYFLRVPQETHEVGRAINYKGRLGRINRVTKEGIYVNFFTEGKGINVPSKHETFISEKEVEKNVYPENLNLPQLTFGALGGKAPIVFDF